MAIVLLLICFVALTFLFLNKEKLRESILKSILVFSVFVIGITELLSLFILLNYNGLLISWSVLGAGLLFLAIKNKPFHKIEFLKSKLKIITKNFTKLEWFLISFSIFILVGILIQGLIYPTNNWDSMTYHMARIVHWIQNESLSHYRTPVYPQINSPPFAEQVILTVNLFAGNDYLSNTVQLFYLVATAIAISLLAKQVGLSKFGQILTAFIFICIPEVILLGSSTHTELVASFFMVSSIYYLALTLSKQTLNSFLLLGFSLGLSTATKSTAYIYLAPFILIWIAYLFYQIITKKQQFKWAFYLLMTISFITINSGHYLRNYQTTTTVFGTNEAIQNYYVNEEHSFLMMVSNVSRNLSSQFGIPKLAQTAQSTTEKLHELIGVDVNDRKTTSHTYAVDPLATHENNGANTYHMILILLSCFWLLFFFKKQDVRIKIYWIAIILSFLLFCFYLKWQPWAKLHAPFFIFYSIVLAHFLIQMLKSKILLFLVLAGFAIHAFTMLVFNYSRPLITLTPFTSEIKITDTRYKKYFSRFLEYHNDYKIVNDILDAKNLKSIGLLFGNYEMEYQLFLNTYRSNRKPIHINSCALSEGIPVKEKVDCIVTKTSESQINYDGETYYNVTKDNDGCLYLFLKR